MYREGVQPVLRCGQCNKPFDKQSTLKRHGYYCRSRRSNIITKNRSCISCAKGKSRCDNRRPECSRCIAKGIECHYPTNTSKGAGSRIQHNDDAPNKQKNLAPPLVADSPSVGNGQEASNDKDLVLDSALVLPDSEFADLGQEYLDWNDPNIDLVEYLNPQGGNEAVQYHSLDSPSSHLTDQTVQGQQVISSLNVTIPAQPTKSVRSLILRPKMNGAQRIANLILHTLRSYPLMMLRHNALPPFIHPRLLSSFVENNYMEPLTNCLSLVHMISSGVQGSRKLFWKNVRLECERWCEDYLKLSKWELLATMQALSIYILIRLDEGETDYNNFDALLLATVIIISKRLACDDTRYSTESVRHNHDLETGWKDWIFEESKRRLCVVYKVVNLLVFFEPASLCDLQTDLVIAPLPAKRQLWEADNEFSWKAESESGPGIQTPFGLAANGELVKLDEGQPYCGDAMIHHKPLDSKTPLRNTTNWEEWCSGMDGLGGLVMLAATLVA